MSGQPVVSNSDSTKGRPGREPEHASYGEAALQSEVRGLDPLAGERLKQLFVASLRMGSLVAGDELRLERAEAMLTSAGRVTLKLPSREVDKAVTKGLRAGMRSPRSAPAFGTIRSRNDAILYWIQWFEHLDPAEFVGTRGSSLLRLFAGFAITGVIVGKVDIRMSVRQAVEASGLGHTKVGELMKPNGEVVRSGYLKVVGRRARPGDLDSWKATKWRPTTKGRFAVQDGCSVDGTTSLYRKTPLLSPDVNVFVRKPNAWRLHCLLRPDEEVTVAELVIATGITADTVRTNLKFLAEQGLAFRIDRTTWRGTIKSPDKKASAPDGLDHAALRRERHEAERNSYRMWRDVRRTYRDTPRGELINDSDVAGEWFDPEEEMPVFDPETGEIVVAMDTTYNNGPAVMGM